MRFVNGVKNGVSVKCCLRATKMVYNYARVVRTPNENVIIKFEFPLLKLGDVLMFQFVLKNDQTDVKQNELCRKEGKND